MPPKEENYEVLFEEAESEVEDLVSDIRETYELGQKTRTDLSTLNLFKARLARLDATYERFIDKIASAKRYGRVLLQDTAKFDPLKKGIRTIYYETLSFGIEHSQVEHADRTADRSLDGTHHYTHHHIKLPEIKLPNFDGTITDWASFKDTFMSLIHINEDLTGVQKFHYLKGALKGQASQIISAIPVTEIGYPQAWTALSKRLDNKTVQATNYLNKIFSYKPLQKRSLQALQHFSSNVLENAISYRNLDAPDPAGFILLTFALQLLDPKTRERFEDDYFERPEIPKWEDFHDFIQSQCIRLQSSVQPNPSSTALVPAQSFRPQPPRRQILMLTDKQSEISPCVICREPHKIYICPKFIAMSPDARYQEIKKVRRCFNCLAAGHGSSNCTSEYRCRHCHRLHHTLLHISANSRSPLSHLSSAMRPPRSKSAPPTRRRALSTPVAALPPAATTSVVQISEPPSAILASATTTGSQVLLGTAIARILDHSGILHEIRLVVDSGSQRSFITFAMAKKLRLPVTQNPHRLCGFADTPIPGGQVQTTCVLCPTLSCTPRLEVAAVVIPQISGSIPRHPVPCEIGSQFEGYDLADPRCFVPGPVDFLLGADLFCQIISGPAIKADAGFPDGLPTIFGLVLLGPIGIKQNVHSDVTLFVGEGEDQDPLDHLLQRFWDIEEVPPVAQTDPLDALCEEHFVSHTARTATGRFCVRLPFRKNDVILGNSRNMALYRFHRLEAKLMAAPTLRGEYNDVLTSYISEGFIHRSPHPGSYLLPHHGVYKNAPGSKLRIVFDASARTSLGSLNDHLLTGPKLQSDIRLVLLNFRRYRWVFTADIEQMYLQILIHPDDRSYLHFVYRFDSSEAISEFEFSRLPFGLSSSPFLAMRVISQLIMEDGAKYPLASKALQDHRYVDDVLTGANSIDEAIQLREELIALLDKGCFKLKKWASNSVELLPHLPSDLSPTPISLSDLEASFIKLLGMQWDPTRDSLSYQVNPGTKTTHTKRGVMSVIARIYDPLGYLAPVVFTAKRLLQSLWAQNLGWDSPLPAPVVVEWNNFLKELPALQKIQIPRFLFPNGLRDLDLIGFADASTLGYAAVVYVRSTLEDGRGTTQLIAAKTRVAPMKPLTVPRLELSAALLLVKTISSLKPFLDQLNVRHTYLFSDSTIALSWLKIEPHNLKTFVANRVGLILSLSRLDQWHHVSSENNMADIASRGAPPSLFVDRADWFHGPDWLNQPFDSWPISSRFTSVDSANIPELKTATVLATSVQEQPVLISLSEAHSSLSKIVRIIAYVRRFAFNVRAAKDERKSNAVTLPELKEATIVLIRNYQLVCFRKEFPLDRSKLVKGLTPFLDPDGVLRVGGRLEHSPLAYDTKHPILLPAKSHLTDLIIDHLHRIHLHAGPRLLHSLIRQKYWILSANRAIKARIHKCLVCYRRSSKNFSPRMGDLPPSRFAQGRAFLNTGIDFAGPFMLKDSPRRKYNVVKCYVCLFVCFGTKAVHLEVVSSLTTEAFLASLGRFIARRGCPSKIYTDNGRNFLGAYRHLQAVREWWKASTTQNAIETELASREISWHFIPPMAPHFGGLWEAGVKSFKYHLDRVLSSQPVTFEELTTIIAHIEAILNSRPICPISAEPENYDCLTPGHFLIGAPLVAAPEYNYTDEKTNRLSRWQFVQLCSQQIWNRWRLDYLHELQQRGKWVSGHPKISVGTMVLLRDPNVPPLDWPTGRVIEVFPGPDDVVRVVKIRTPKGEFQRSVSRLAPLFPLAQDDPE